MFKLFLCDFAHINLPKHASMWNGRKTEYDDDDDDDDDDNTMAVSIPLFSFARQRKTNVLSINTKIVSVSKHHIIIFSTKRIFNWNPHFFKTLFNRLSCETIMKELNKISARIRLNLTFFIQKVNLNSSGWSSSCCCKSLYFYALLFKNNFCGVSLLNTKFLKTKMFVLFC